MYSLPAEPPASATFDARVFADLVQPSRRERLPEPLFDTTADGRALVAADVQGCREIAVAGKITLLVRPDNPKARPT